MEPPGISSIFDSEEIGWPYSRIIGRYKRVIVATKGLPFTGRERLSQRIASWANCPIFSLYGVLNGLSEEKGHTCSSKTRPSEAEGKSLEQQAFNILCKMAKVNTPRRVAGGIVQFVVIDSPLSSTCQLDQLLEVIENSGTIDYKLIIIECRVKNIHKWRMRFDRPGQYKDICKVFFELSGIYDEREWGSMPPLWFLPKCWEDAERAIQAYDARTWDDHFLSRCANSRHIRKIVLDPELDMGFMELEEERRTSPFVEAISSIIDGKEVPPVIELDQWTKQLMERKLSFSLSLSEKSTQLCENGDCLFKYEDYLEDGTTCMACDKKITQQGYACRSCTLALHKSCAEIHPYEPKFLYTDDTFRYLIFGHFFTFELEDACRFPKTHVCDSCRSYSWNCASCILKTHLKCRLMPTIIKDDNCHNHLLSIRLALNHFSEHGRYSCKACGEEGGLCSYFCMICRFSYHVRCAISPRELEHQHGGYNHFMKLKSSRVEEEEDYWCDVCCKDMDPECWYYSCQKCPYYVTHIHCAHVKQEHQMYLPSRLQPKPESLALSLANLRGARRAFQSLKS